MDSATEKDVFSENEWKTIIDELSLSGRQSEIIRGLFSGYSDKQVAKELNIAVPTVRTHLTRLFSKFNIQDRNELILYVFRQSRKKL